MKKFSECNWIEKVNMKILEERVILIRQAKTMIIIKWGSRQRRRTNDDRTQFSHQPSSAERHSSTTQESDDLLQLHSPSSFVTISHSISFKFGSWFTKKKSSKLTFSALVWLSCALYFTWSHRCVGSLTVSRYRNIKQSDISFHV